jgi:hypothetical protein
MSFRLASAALAAVACAFALAACGGGSKSPQSTSTNLAAAWHRVVLCARAHGMPTLADPTIDSNGRAQFPAGIRIPAATRRACQAMADRLEPGGVDNPLTQAQLAGLLNFARCMRAHGVPDWPDPSANGEFPVDTRLQHLLKSAIRAPLTACVHFDPDHLGRINVHATPS